jgi:probable F420-dependent oxidoreductase
MQAPHPRALPSAKDFDFLAVPDRRSRREEIPKMKLWKVMQTTAAAAQIANFARAAEDAGIDGIWAPQLFSPPFPALAAAAMASSKLKLGTGIALAFTRTPLETALNAIDLDLISGGRFILGLGTSTREFNERFHGVTYGRPVAHLREVALAVRQIVSQCHSGGIGKLEGEYHKMDLTGFRTLTRPVRESIPIYLPALFESTVRLAGEIGDGLIGHPVWSHHWVSNQAKAALDGALAAAGRTRDQIHVNLWIYTAISDRRAEAIDDLRGTIAFYSSIPQYEKYYAAHGFGAQARAVCEAAARGDTAGMIKAVPDEMVNTFGIAGTADEARERVAKMGEHADSLTLVPPQHMIRGAKIGAYDAAIARTFYGR